MEKKTPLRTLVVILLACWLLIQVYPLIFMVQSAFKTESEIVLSPMALPTKLRLDGFIQAWSGKTEGIAFSHYFCNSLIVTVCAIALLCIAALLAGYALARLHFPGQGLIYMMVVCLIAVPTQALIIPLFDLYEKLHWTNSIWTMIPLYAAFSLPFSLFIMKTNIEAIPKEIEDAAQIDGCGPLKNFIYIITPMSRSSIATIAIVNLTGIWSELLYATVFWYCRITARSLL